MTTGSRPGNTGRRHRFAAPPWVIETMNGRDYEAPLSMVRDLAAQSGLGISAVTSSEPFCGLHEMLTSHVDAGRLAGLDWFDQERAFVASHPRQLHGGARSIIACGLPYYTGPIEKPSDEPRGRIARYAWGIDYHRIFRTRLKDFQQRLEESLGRRIEARLLSDTARIVDRAVSARAGLGWYGKHSCLIVPGFGSWVMLGEMIVDLDVEQTTAIDHDCGSCSRCIDNCPTGAIVAPYIVETPRCLSFQTIEQREAIPLELRPLLGDWVFGCDVCQEVCPYTGAAQITHDADFAPRAIDNAFPRLHWLLEISEVEFRSAFQKSAVLRAKRRGLARNAAVALGNTGDESSVAVLAAALDGHDEQLVRGHAAWALGNLGGARARAALGRARQLESDPAARAEIELALAR